MIADRIAVVLAAVLVLLLWFDFEGDIAQRDAFSWMDPEQYYLFARDLHANGMPEGGFAVPSIFPAVIAPFLSGDAAPSRALRVNGAFLVLIALATWWLVRSAGRTHAGERTSRIWAALAVPLVLTTPLLAGLSRELYIEYALTALVAWHLWVWTRTSFRRFDGWWLLFALFTAIGLLTKMTYPLFLAGGLVVETALAIRGRNGGRWFRVALAVAIPIGAVLLAIRIFLPESFTYYISFGNTRIPIMRLIGPPDLLSLDSLLYYPRFFLTAGLGWLAPLALALGLLAIAIPSVRRSFWNRERAILLATVIAPMVILAAQAVKEPRHIAPCLVPALVLVTIAASRLTPARRAISIGVALLLVSAGQYAEVRRSPAPYRLHEALPIPEWERQMVAASPEAAAHTSPSGRLDALTWRYTQSIAIEGFDPNEALAITWYFRPAVVFNLDLDQWEGEDRTAYRRFEDLYYFPAFNTYNARCGWKKYYVSLSREEVLAHADFTLSRDDGGVRIEHNETRRPASFREVYARRYLAEGAPGAARDLSALYFAFFMEERLRGRIPEPGELERGFPGDFRYGERRNIYWMNVYGPLVRKTEDAIGSRAR
ncbi:MAG: hypothetical protein HKN20_01475 [Gemmatimonadetes bacterium]|nr:hypothetical protein [Gemmatimonadota bacterium]